MLNPHLPAFSIALYTDLYAHIPTTIFAGDDGIPEILCGNDIFINLYVEDSQVYVSAHVHYRHYADIPTYVYTGSDNFNYDLEAADVSRKIQDIYRHL